MLCCIFFFFFFNASSSKYSLRQSGNFARRWIPAILQCSLRDLSQEARQLLRGPEQGPFLKVWVSAKLGTLLQASESQIKAGSLCPLGLRVVLLPALHMLTLQSFKTHVTSPCYSILYYNNCGGSCLPFLDPGGQGTPSPFLSNHHSFPDTCLC